AIDTKDRRRRGWAGSVKLYFRDVAPRRIWPKITDIAEGVCDRDCLGGHNGFSRRGWEREQIGCNAEIRDVSALKFAADHAGGPTAARAIPHLGYRVADAGAKIEANPFTSTGIGAIEEGAEITIHRFFFGVAAIVPGTSGADDG